MSKKYRIKYKSKTGEYCPQYRWFGLWRYCDKELRFFSEDSAKYLIKAQIEKGKNRIIDVDTKKILEMPDQLASSSVDVSMAHMQLLCDLEKRGNK